MYQTDPSGAGATSCGWEPARTGYSWISHRSSGEMVRCASALAERGIGVAAAPLVGIGWTPGDGPLVDEAGTGGVDAAGLPAGRQPRMSSAANRAATRSAIIDVEVVLIRLAPISAKVSHRLRQVSCQGNPRMRVMSCVPTKRRGQPRDSTTTLRPPRVSKSNG